VKNLAGIDLNLLVALDALVNERHVGRAAKRIGLSQPAASHALQRLRNIMNDPLLVRTGARMQLTRRAEALRAPLAQLLQQMGSLFVGENFDPQTSTRRFVMMVPDHVVDFFIPALIERIARRAPNVRLDIRPWRGPAALQEDFALEIDIVIACTSEPLAGFRQQRLFRDTEALAVRRAHPLGPRLRRLDAFSKARHIAVVGHGHREDPVDTWLREEGIERRIAILVPGYLQALHVAARTDLVAFVPHRLIETLESPLSLRTVTPPIDPGEYEELMFHPSRSQVDAGSIWLRSQVLHIARTLERRFSAGLAGSRRGTLAPKSLHSA